jgi:hypothetical protein
MSSYVRYVAIATALTLVSYRSGAGDRPVQPVLSARAKQIITVDGYQFKDLNGNGQLDPYEERALLPRRWEVIPDDPFADVALAGARAAGKEGASTQSKRRRTVMGSITRSYCGGRYGPRRRPAICQIRFAK